MIAESKKGISRQDAKDAEESKYQRRKTFTTEHTESTEKKKTWQSQRQKPKA